MVILRDIIWSLRSAEARRSSTTQLGFECVLYVLASYLATRGYLGKSREGIFGSIIIPSHEFTAEEIAVGVLPADGRDTRKYFARRISLAICLNPGVRDVMPKF